MRKEPKKHGTQKFVEGMDATDGKSVVILDDVCTKGDSTWQAIAKAQDAGMQVLGAICLVDRQQGATEMLAGKGIVLEHVFTLAELVAHKDGLSVEHRRTIGVRERPNQSRRAVRSGRVYPGAAREQPAPPANGPGADERSHGSCGDSDPEAGGNDAWLSPTARSTPTRSSQARCTDIVRKWYRAPRKRNQRSASVVTKHSNSCLIKNLLALDANSQDTEF